MVKLVCFSLFVFRYSFFALCFLFSFFGICFPLFVIRYSFFAFRFSLFIFRFFFHSKSGRMSYFDIQNPILTLEIVLDIVLWQSYSDIRTWDEYHIATFKILFWHSNWGPISYFDIHYPFWHSKNRAECCILKLKNTILTFDIGPNIKFWHSKSYFDIQTEAEYRI